MQKYTFPCMLDSPIYQGVLPKPNLSKKGPSLQKLNLQPQN